MTSIKRSSAVPLALVPALASLMGCGPDNPALASEADPCLPARYQQQLCETAVAHQGYHYNGAFFPHVYGYPALFYYNGYSSFVRAGGRVRAIAPNVYSPSYSVPRAAVSRGGFGGIGGSRGFSGG